MKRERIKVALKTEKSKKNFLLSLAVMVCILSVASMVIVLTMKGQMKQSEFIPPSFEKNAVSGIPDVPEELKWGEVNAPAYKASVCGVVIIQDEKADIWLKNMENNSVWLKLRVMDKEGNILGETGLLKPGQYVQSVEFDEIPNDGATIRLKLMAYQPDTYYSEGSVTLNTVVRVEE